MKRELYVINVAKYYGGGEIFMTKLAALLHADRRVTVVSPYMKSMEDALKRADAELIALPGDGPLSTRTGFLRWLWDNRRKFKSGSDLLLNSRSAAYLTPLVALISRVRPVVVAHTELSGKVTIKEVLYATALRFAGSVVCVSNTVADQHKRRWPTLKVASIPNWLDGQRRSEIATVAASDLPIDVAVVARLEDNKGVGDILSACSKIANIRLHIYGDGPLRTQLEALAGKNSTVTFHGHVDDLSIRLPHHSMFISASRSESFSYAVAEAIDAGLLCVVSDIPAHRELLGEHYPSALFFPSKDVEAAHTSVSSGLAMLVSSDDTRATDVIEQVRCRIELRNSPELARSHYIRILDECFGRTPIGGRPT